jgi:anthranilate phosphoribosyltransferase
MFQLASNQASLSYQALPGGGASGESPLPLMMESIASGRDLSQGMAAQLFSRLMDGELSPAQAGSLLMGLRAKGETPVEMSEAAEAVLDRARPLPPLAGPVLDIVGTGGDGRNSFNCSTATALVMAGLGYKVVKHGNRSVSSCCGSADVLEQLGLDLNTPPEAVPAELEKRNFTFLFAPNYHPCFRHIMPVRKELGIRTLFNILGPLVNPARPEHSFLGAANPEILPLMARTLARRGAKLSAVVHGAGGYDELTTLGPAQVMIVCGGQSEEMALDPAEFGFTPCDPRELSISGPVEGAAVLRELLHGRGPRPMRDMLALNVALALYIMTGAVSLAACVKEARQAVADGAGRGVLN